MIACLCAVALYQFVLEPQAHVNKIFAFLDIENPVDLAAVGLQIDSTTNRKYQLEYSKHLESSYGQQEHQFMKTEFAERIAKLGYSYDLDDFALQQQGGAEQAAAHGAEL